MTMENFQKNRVRGSLVGGAVGDALGYAIEFTFSYDEIVRYYGPDGITRYDLNNPRALGIISDDTQMTLFTACGLLNAKSMGRAPVPSVCWAYLEWYNTQLGFRSKRLRDCWVGDLPEMNVQRGPGHTCLSALKTIQAGREVYNEKKGCGGVMRVAPVALYGLSQDRIKDIFVLDEMAADIAEITHQHPLGYIPAYIQSHMVYRLATDENPSRESFRTYLNEAMTGVKAKYGEKPSYVVYMQSSLDKALQLAEDNLPDHKAIEELGEGWVAEETLAIAVYCTYKYIDDFEKAVVASVNHGGDSDSTGALTGNLVGAALGYDAIPEHYKTKLELHDVILHVADDLYRGYTTRYVPKQ